MTSFQHEIEFRLQETEKQQRRMAVAAIAKLSIAFDKQMADEQIDLYINMIYDLPSDALEKAVDHIIANEKFFPAIATIRKTAVEQHWNEQLLSPEEAWAFICRRISKGGRAAGTTGLTLEMKFAVDACGGWMALCQSEHPQRDRYTFTKAYKDRQERVKQLQSQPSPSPEELDARVVEFAKAIKQLRAGEL